MSVSAAFYRTGGKGNNWQTNNEPNVRTQRGDESRAENDRVIRALRQISLKASEQHGILQRILQHGPTHNVQRVEKSPIRPHISPGDKRLPDNDGKYSGFGDTPDRRFIAQLHPVPYNNSVVETKRNCTSRAGIYLPLPLNENMYFRMLPFRFTVSQKEQNFSRNVANKNIE